MNTDEATLGKQDILFVLLLSYSCFFVYNADVFNI